MRTKLNTLQRKKKWQRNTVKAGQSNRVFIKIRMFHLSKAFISHSHYYTPSRSRALSFDHIDIVLRLYLEDCFPDC